MRFAAQSTKGRSLPYFSQPLTQCRSQPWTNPPACSLMGAPPARLAFVPCQPVGVGMRTGPSSPVWHSRSVSASHYTGGMDLCNDILFPHLIFTHVSAPLPSGALPMLVPIPPLAEPAWSQEIRRPRHVLETVTPTFSQPLTMCRTHPGTSPPACTLSGVPPTRLACPVSNGGRGHEDRL